MQLLLNDNSSTPIARYRRAKLGIVSRSRRAFLEIFPAGVNLVDFCVRRSSMSSTKLDGLNLNRL
jgi:hypothetical protein